MAEFCSPLWWKSLHLFSSALLVHARDVWWGAQVVHLLHRDSKVEAPSSVLTSTPHAKGQISHRAVQKALLVPCSLKTTHRSIWCTVSLSPQGSPGMVQCKSTLWLLQLSSTRPGWSPWPKCSGMQITRQSCPCWYPFQALFPLGTNTASNSLVGLQRSEMSW